MPSGGQGDVARDDFSLEHSPVLLLDEVVDNGIGFVADREFSAPGDAVLALRSVRPLLSFG